ncbi:PAS domain-containing sensor histidine kinase [Pseudocnuella soli]|uniref:PAS domain-containing sensor histidine kinase n=1 Tax=Pseudocnuella soli TaxID=2502779 RepID=UPI00104A8E52|nr:PAS domain S-box protein [Pseudocnuella soli]
MMLPNIQVSQTILDKAPVIILVIGVDGRVTYINQWGCQLIGAAKETVLNKDWIDEFVVSENKVEVKSYFNQVMRQETKIMGNFENCIRSFNDGVLFVSWNSNLMLDEAGSVQGIITIGEDVTDKKILLKKLLSQESVNRSTLNRAIETARASERDEIASELHDNINQNLTTCKLLLEQELQGHTPLPFVSKAYTILKESINEIRNLSHRISSGSLTFSDFELSLKNSLEEIKLATGVNYRLSITGKDALNNAPIAIIANIFRIMQEQLNNIVKHADAASIHIALQADKNAINMEIKDDGKGFNPNGVKRGLGLNNIFKRAELNHGKVYVDTAPGQGCLISVIIPLD